MTAWRHSWATWPDSTHQTEATTAERLPNAWAAACNELLPRQSVLRVFGLSDGVLGRLMQQRREIRDWLRHLLAPEMLGDEPSRPPQPPTTAQIRALYLLVRRHLHVEASCIYPALAATKVLRSEIEESEVEQGQMIRLLDDMLAALPGEALREARLRVFARLFRQFDLRERQWLLPGLRQHLSRIERAALTKQMDATWMALLHVEAEGRIPTYENEAADPVGPTFP
jgi:hypothetical protein